MTNNHCYICPIPKSLHMNRTTFPRTCNHILMAQPRKVVPSNLDKTKQRSKINRYCENLSDAKPCSSTTNECPRKTNIDVLYSNKSLWQHFCLTLLSLFSKNETTTHVCFVLSLFPLKFWDKSLEKKYVKNNADSVFPRLRTSAFYFSGQVLLIWCLFGMCMATSSVFQPPINEMTSFHIIHGVIFILSTLLYLIPDLPQCNRAIQLFVYLLFITVITCPYAWTLAMSISANLTPAKLVAFYEFKYWTDMVNSVILLLSIFTLDAVYASRTRYSWILHIWMWVLPVSTHLSQMALFRRYLASSATCVRVLRFQIFFLTVAIIMGYCIRWHKEINERVEFYTCTVINKGFKSNEDCISTLSETQLLDTYDSLKSLLAKYQQCLQEINPVSTKLQIIKETFGEIMCQFSNISEAFDDITSFNQHTKQTHTNEYTKKNCPANSSPYTHNYNTSLDMKDYHSSEENKPNQTFPVNVLRFNEYFSIKPNRKFQSTHSGIKSTTNSYKHKTIYQTTSVLNRSCALSSVPTQSLWTSKLINNTGGTLVNSIASLPHSEEQCQFRDLSLFQMTSKQNEQTFQNLTFLKFKKNKRKRTFSGAITDTPLPVKISNNRSVVRSVTWEGHLSTESTAPQNTPLSARSLLIESSKLIIPPCPVSPLKYPVLNRLQPLLPNNTNELSLLQRSLGKEWSFNLLSFNRGSFVDSNPYHIHHGGYAYDNFGNVLTEVGHVLLQPYLQRLKKSSSILDIFLYDLQNHYLLNPYHNQLHGAMVAHATLCITHYMSIWSNSRTIASELDYVSVTLAALSHDVGHPARTNMFFINTYDTLAVLYNDTAVLENFHSCLTFNLLDRSSLLKELKDKEFRIMRKNIIHLILSTDMSQHFENLAIFRNRRISPDFDYNSNVEDLWLVLRMCIKLGDLGHSMLDWVSHYQWGMRVAEEFYQQGDEEAALGFPKSPLCDRNDHGNFAKSQKGFLDFIVLPLLKELEPLSETKIRLHLTSRLLINKKNWNDYIRKSDVPPVPKELTSQYKTSSRHVSAMLLSACYCSPISSNHYTASHNPHRQSFNGDLRKLFCKKRIYLNKKFFNTQTSCSISNHSETNSHRRSKKHHGYEPSKYGVSASPAPMIQNAYVKRCLFPTKCRRLSILFKRRGWYPSKAVEREYFIPIASEEINKPSLLSVSPMSSD